MRENADESNSECGHSLRSVTQFGKLVSKYLVEDCRLLRPENFRCFKSDRTTERLNILEN